MAYWPNGTSYMIDEERMCSRCIHNASLESCPILLLHDLWNYEAVGKEPRM